MCDNSRVRHLLTCVDADAVCTSNIILVHHLPLISAPGARGAPGAPGALGAEGALTQTSRRTGSTRSLASTGGLVSSEHSSPFPARLKSEHGGSGRVTRSLVHLALSGLGMERPSNRGRRSWRPACSGRLAFKSCTSCHLTGTPPLWPRASTSWECDWDGGMRDHSRMLIDPTGPCVTSANRPSVNDG